MEKKQHEVGEGRLAMMRAHVAWAKRFMPWTLHPQTSQEQRQEEETATAFAAGLTLNDGEFYRFDEDWPQYDPRLDDIDRHEHQQGKSYE